MGDAGISRTFGTALGPRPYKGITGIGGPGTSAIVKHRGLSS